MTVIAWDGATLAADTLCTTADGAVIYGDKIWRTPLGLFGGAGDDNAVEKIRIWLMRGGKERHKPTLAQDASVVCLVVRPDKTLCVIDHQLTPVPYHAQKFAIGTGGPPALAYMKAGKSAAQAVQMVIDGNWDGCGGSVQTLALKRAKKGIRKR